MATRNPAGAEPFNNDTADNAQREAHLEQHGCTIEGEDGAWVLVQPRAGAMLLDAETHDDALFEACNIVKD